MTHIITAFVSTALVFALIDVVWISQVARPYIFTKIESLLELNITAAVIFYLVYIGGIILFAVYPALNTAGNGFKYALVYGALFGFFCYATYDLTNMATLRDWSWSMVVLDVAWGTILTGASAALGYYITNSLLG